MAQFLLHCYPKLARHETRQLIDTSGRKLVLLVSDCRSQLWQNGSIHEWLREWSKQGPTAIAQVLPERLWRETELDVGFPVQASSLIPGAANAKLNLRGLSPRQRQQIEDPLTVPIVTLSAPSLQQLARVVAAMGNQRVPARIFDLVWVKAEDRQKDSVMPPAASAEAKVDLFEATASPVARELASYMAAVPVNMSVINLLQKHLAKYATLVHVAEIYGSGLLVRQAPPPGSEGNGNDSEAYDFAPGVRKILNQRTEVDRTEDAFEVLSQEIARALGLESIRSFTALLTPKPGWTPEQKAQILPFAQIATEVLRNLGGDYALLAAEVERDARRQKDWIEPPITFPPTQELEFETAQLVEATEEAPEKVSFPPPLQTRKFEFFTLELEPITDLGSTWEDYEFTTATVRREERQGLLRLFGRSRWVIRKEKRTARNRLLKVQLSDDVLLEMVAVPGGTFTMGSPQDEPERNSDEGPQREVTVSSLLMGRYPVTQAQWKAVAALPQVKRELNADPSRFKGGDRPVERVSWYDAVEFCDRLSALTKQEYRLPSEAEWEYACRAGTQTPFYYGQTLTTELANYGGNYSYDGGPKGEYRGKTTPVGQFPANAFGLHDMHGNVWEWCQDRWHGSYKGAPTDGSAWLSDQDSRSYVRRGGSWVAGPGFCRSACRDWFSPGFDDSTLGFRVVCVAPRT